MKKRKIAEEVKRRAQQAERRDRARMVDSEIVEALRLCRGTVDRETLLKVCPFLSIPGAVELGLLVERSTASGPPTYAAGPRLHDGNCDLTKAIDMAALIGQVARGE